MERVSRQRLLYLSRVEQGKCGACGKDRSDSCYSDSCLACSEKQRIRQRKRKNMNEWHPGGRGRPPLYLKLQKPLVNEKSVQPEQ